MPHPNAVVEVDAVKWWEPTKFRGQTIENESDVQAAALSSAGDVLNTLHGILLDSTAKESDRIAAASLLLDRAIGKATQKVEVEATYTPPELEGENLQNMLEEAMRRIEEKKQIIDIE